MDENDLVAIPRQVYVAALDITSAKGNRLAEQLQPAQGALGLLNRSCFGKISDELLIRFSGFIALAHELLIDAQLEQGLRRVGALRVLVYKRLEVGQPFGLDLLFIGGRIALTGGVM